MYEILLVLHIGVCFLLILTVLLQSGKGAGLNLFGGGGDTLFSAPSGSSFMRQFTTGLAATFAFTSLFFTLFASRNNMRTVTGRLPAPPPVHQPHPPAAAGSAPGPRAGQRGGARARRSGAAREARAGHEAESRSSRRGPSRS